ncbi:Uncharacterised protein [Mycobacterium tuberculosis]|nr:Uncharacterised protein [Mycobacterium tuberculosis]
MPVLVLVLVLVLVVVRGWPVVCWWWIAIVVRGGWRRLFGRFLSGCVRGFRGRGPRGVWWW